MKTLKHTRFVMGLIFLILLLLSSCHTRSIKGSGHVASESRNISGFTSIDVSSALSVVYTEGSTYSVEVTADDNLIGYITTELKGDELRIGIKEGKSFRNVTITEIKVTSPSLTTIEVSGASSFVTKNTCHSNSLNLKLSGASSSVVNAEVTALYAELSGASNVVITGTANDISIEGSGASTYKAQNLVCNSAVVNFSGASNGHVNVQNSLTATLSGASNLDYYGNPTVSVNTSGSSSINKK